MIFFFFTGQCSVRCYSCSSKIEGACLKPSIHEVSLVKCDTNALQTTKKYARSLDSKYDQLFEVDILDTNRLELACLKVVTRGNIQLSIYQKLLSVRVFIAVFTFFNTRSIDVKQIPFGTVSPWEQEKSQRPVFHVRSKDITGRLQNYRQQGELKRCIHTYANKIQKFMNYTAPMFIFFCSTYQFLCLIPYFFIGFSGF